MDTLRQAVRRFPLVARDRPACPSLDERVREISELAQAATGQSGEAALSQAAAAHNKAALIASDCGLRELARALCRRQHTLYLHARPLGAQTARYALEPIVNLARLLIRDGDGDGAYQLLDTLYQAVTSRTEVVIDGQRLTLTNFTGSDADHRTVCQWLWAVLLGDGTRALTSTGQWSRALAHAEQRHGVGRRLLDGRQVAVLARHSAGDWSAALALVEESTLVEPWEHLVAACLTVLCLRAGGRPATAAMTAMAERYLRFRTPSGLALFHVRVGLTVLDLMEDIDQLDASAAGHLLEEAVVAGDGYVARDVLAHAGCRRMLTGDQEQALVATLRSSGIGGDTMAPKLEATLLAAVRASEATTTRNLRILAEAPPTGVRNR
ncbi:hypothetical protein [Streptosporangium saharense]|uniref:hypothetical protein n=1 Tax=Streptosporangium saharense TaxID=1706840 RepID=UPI00342C7717